MHLNINMETLNSALNDIYFNDIWIVIVFKFYEIENVIELI